MNQADIIAAFRIEADDAVAPYLVSDAKLTLWTAEAEREGAERSRYIRTSADDDIALVINQRDYAFPADIIQLDSLQIDGINYPLTQINRHQLRQRYSAVATCDGLPLYFLLEGAVLSLFPTPTATGVLKVYGRRLPRGASLSETPVDLHESLIFWLLHKYYSVRDADLYAPELAANYLARFEAVFGRKKPVWLQEVQKTAPVIKHFGIAGIR